MSKLADAVNAARESAEDYESRRDFYADKGEHMDAQECVAFANELANAIGRIERAWDK